jgi:branched-chain amino acid aminotransferase
MPSYAYFKGKYVPVEQANLNIMTNFMHYGTGVFEGIRGNWNSGRKQLYLFRLKEHYERLLSGCKILNIDLPLSIDDMIDISVKVTAKSAFKEDVYMRPVAYKSSEVLGVRLHNLDCDFFATVFPWGRYIDTDSARCMVSTWRFPGEVARAKFTGLYLTNALAKTEAINNGFDEAIMLSANGYVAEGSGENIFLMRDGKLVTPPSSDGILVGITRDTIMKLAKNELGIDTVERHVDRTELYSSDEIFITGTAAHLTPISEIDRRKVADGEIGPVTKKLQKLYKDVILNKIPRYSSWCTPVYPKK